MLFLGVDILVDVQIDKRRKKKRNKQTNKQKLRCKIFSLKVNLRSGEVPQGIKVFAVKS